MKKELKAQAALEFLTTYGWAFLVIIIMISALAYFGILDPSKLLPERCNFGTEMACEDYLIDVTNSQFRLRLKNSVGEVIDVSDISVGTGGKKSLVCTPPTKPTSWKSDTMQDLLWTACGYTIAGIQAGDKAKLNITITYYAIKSGSDYKHDVKGEVYANAR